MDSFLDSIPSQLKGLLIIIAGTLLLLHTLGIVERGINTILIAASVAMIIYGFFMTGYYRKLIKNSNQKPSDE